MTAPQFIKKPLTLFFQTGSRRPWSRDRTFQPSPEATFRTTASDLAVISTDLFIKDNSETSHTNPFYANETRSDSLIVRRGEPFHLGITLSRLLSDYDILNLIFTVSGKLPLIIKVWLKKSKMTWWIFPDVKNPSYSNNTEVTVPIKSRWRSSSLEGGEWRGKIEGVESEKNSYKVLVESSVDAIVGSWKLRIDLRSRDSPRTSSHFVTDKIFLLFNPWSKSMYYKWSSCEL